MSRNGHRGRSHPRSKSREFHDVGLDNSDVQRGIVLKVQSDDPPVDEPFRTADTVPNVMTREDLDRKWLPYFQGYVFSGCGSCRGGITALCCCRSDHPAVPIRVLVNCLTHSERDEGDFPQRLPNDVVEEIIRLSDIDYDDWITYDEFVHLVLHERSEHKRAGVSKKILDITVKSVTPVWYHSSYTNCRPPPVFLLVISALCIIIFIAYAFTMENGAFRCPCHSPLVYSPRFRFEVWRWFTYSFIHGSWDHLVVNLIMLLLVGIPLEIVHKWHRIIIIWICGVVAGSLFHSVIDPTYALVGASGGTYALLCAHVANVVLNYREMLYNKIRVAVLVVYFALDIGLAVYHRFVKLQKPGEAPVSHGAHLGGGVTGALLGLAILQNLKKRFYEGVLWKVALGIYCALILAAILFNIFYDGYPAQNYDKYRQGCTLNPNLACPGGEPGGGG